MQPDAFSDVRASFEYQGEGEGGHLIAQLGHLLVPGAKDALMHLMGMCNLSPEAARAVALIMSAEFQVPDLRQPKARRDLNLARLSEAARIATIYMLLSNSEEARGRNDLTAVLAGTVVRTAKAARNFFQGNKGGGGGPL